MTKSHHSVVGDGKPHTGSQGHLTHMSLQGVCISHKTLQDMKLEAQVFEDIHTSR
jgi:hypothetical protein